MCRNHSAGFTVCRWTGEEDDQVQLFPITATLGIRGLPLHHWKICDLSKIVTKFAHLIDVEDDTLDWKELVMARISINCKTIDSIPKELMIVVATSCRHTKKEENKKEEKKGCHPRVAPAVATCG